MEAMRIQDKQITASSAYRLHKPFYGRLNRVSFYGDPRRTAWCADEDDKAPYMTVDLREVKTISGAAVQGASVSENFVTSFKLCHSVNGRQFECVGQANAMEVRWEWMSNFHHHYHYHHHHHHHQHQHQHHHHRPRRHHHYHHIFKIIFNMVVIIIMIIIIVVIIK